MTKGEIKVGDELEEAKGKLYESDKENQRLEESNRKTIKALENVIRNQVTTEYDRTTKDLKKIFLARIPIFATFVTFVLLLCLMAGAVGVSVFASFLVSAIASIVIGIGFYLHDNKNYINNNSIYV